VNGIAQRRRILVVGDPSNIAIAHWISQLDSAAWDIQFFATKTLPATDRLQAVALHRTFYALWPRVVANILRTSPSKISYFPNFETLLSPAVPTQAFIRLPMPRLPGVVADKLAEIAIPSVLNVNAHALAHVIRRVRPDWVHAFGALEAGYLTLSASLRLGSDMPKWIVTSWGDRKTGSRLSDADRRKIEASIRGADFHASESVSRVRGGRGNSLPETAELDATERKLVFVDLADANHDQVVVTLQGLQDCAEPLRGYTVALHGGGAGHSALPPQGKLHFRRQILRPLSDDARIQLLGLSRTFIAPALSAQSTMLIDAMAMGALPICPPAVFSGISIQHGRNGLRWDNEDLAGLIRRALTDDPLAKTVRDANHDVIRQIYQVAYGTSPA
jgi:hypothetical protein